MSGAIHLLPLYALIAWSGNSLPFYLSTYNPLDLKRSSKTTLQKPPFLTCFSRQFETRDVTAISVLLDIHNRIALSAGPQASPVCPDKSRIKKKIVAALLE
jgi:hypothetical protein